MFTASAAHTAAFRAAFVDEFLANLAVEPDTAIDDLLEMFDWAVTDIGRHVDIGVGDRWAEVAEFFAEHGADLASFGYAHLAS